MSFTQVCSCCGKDKELNPTNYYRSKVPVSGSHHECRECYVPKWKERNKEVDWSEPFPSWMTAFAESKKIHYAKSPEKIEKLAEELKETNETESMPALLDMPDLQAERDLADAPYDEDDYLDRLDELVQSPNMVNALRTAGRQFAENVPARERTERTGQRILRRGNRRLQEFLLRLNEILSIADRFKRLANRGLSKYREDLFFFSWTTTPSFRYAFSTDLFLL